MNIRGSILFLAGLAAALGAGWAGLPRVLYRSRPQPVDFSHQVHTEKAGAKCEDCHAFREDGTFAGVPALDKCAGCHAAPMGTTAAEKDFIDRYITPQREPQWASYARQPENVFFSHAAHVKAGKVECATCHGDLGTGDRLPLDREDRISGYSRPVMRMDACIDCHRQRNRAVGSCLDCHK